MNFEWKLETKSISDLIEFKKNPRKITKKMLENLTRNISKFGLIDKPIVNTDNTIIAGHQRINVLRKLGKKEVDVYVPNRELTEKEFLELNFRHNNNIGSNDDDVLANFYEFQDLIDWGYEDLEKEMTNFDEDDKQIKLSKITFEFDKKDNLQKFINHIDESLPYDLTGTYNIKVKE